MSDFSQQIQNSEIVDTIQHHKNCPKCNSTMIYSSSDSLSNSIRNNRECRSCSKKGLPNGRLGKKYTLETRMKMSLAAKNKPPVSNETRRKLSEAWKNRSVSLETKKKMSESFKGRKFSNEHKLKLSVSNSGKTRSDYTKYKIRLATIADLQRKGIVGVSKNHNPIACKFIDELNKINGWNLQHAQNGGEVELYGYFVDGYDKQRNIIFEYDEPEHYRGYKHRRDLIRQENLLREVTPSLFLRYDEKNNKLYEVK